LLIDGAAIVDDRIEACAAGGAEVVGVEAATRLATVDAKASGYSNAQLDDYRRLPRRGFLWRPPLTLTVRARFSHPAASSPEAPGLLGTAGFGFWNDPFVMSGGRSPMLPRAIWFFYASPPSDMRLNLGTVGYGWKAATIDALRFPALLLAPTAPLAVPLMNVRPLYRSLWPVAQRAMGVSEAPVEADMTAWHTYVIEWGTRRARFTLDGATVLDCDTPPAGPLGLVIWKDNQYMVVTPWGRFRHGLLVAPGAQWLDLAWVAIDDKLARLPEG